MDYLTATELSKKWGVSNRMIAYYCKTKKLNGAIKKGKTWLIPVNTKKPADKRCSKDKIVIKDNQDLQGEFPKINRRDIDNYATVYRANDLYKNLGLTRETLRYYEEIGLITPGRNSSNQYREFTFADISHLLSIDFYKKRGFTLLEIKELIQSDKQSDNLHYLNRKIVDLQKAIQEQQLMIKQLNDTKQFYEDAINSKRKFSVKEMPLYLVLESFDAVSSLNEYQNSVLKYLNLQQDDILSNLVRAVTFDSSGYKGSGMCIVKQPATEREQPPGKVYLESGKCLHTVLEADNRDDSIMEEMFFSCHEWAKNHHVEFKGVVYIFIRFMALSKQTERNFYEVWLPLK
ncbi:MerR family transcriptional regulator [Acetobacterium woodii]|nr:MerR family transcriptional regulator [Acetobacterium woodii]